MLPRLTGQVAATVSTPMLVANIVQQVVVGAALGFLTALLFAAVQAAGSLIDMFGGFSVAFAFDPLSQSGNSVFGRFYGLTAATLLFASDGHQLVLRGFTQSYKAIPLDSGISLDAMRHLVTVGIGQMFLAAVQIAGPIIAVLFIADVGLGLLARAAPALNAFALGFPAKILLTMSLAGTALMALPQSVSTLTERAVGMVVKLLGG
jgi:flagellar biosynthetic protein FliR